MSLSEHPVIVWFRNDLRVQDNPALVAASGTGPVLPVYIHDDDAAGRWRMGAAGRWWLQNSLGKLSDQLDQHLAFFSGSAESILPELVRKTGAKAVYWNRCYEPWRIDRDRRIKQNLRDSGIEVRSFNASLLWEPWEVLKADGTPYKVFTPYFQRGCLGKGQPRRPLSGSMEIRYAAGHYGCSLQQLNLLPEHRWQQKLARYWTIGEAGAWQRLEGFLTNGLAGYREGRDFPAREQTSRLSPHLHFGEISPHRVWHAALAAGLASGWELDLEHFHRELAWREFSYYLLYHFPQLPTVSLQSRFTRFPWREEKNSLKAWNDGMTGYPIVDAGMRELWETGYMHNRVRMIVASFLVKNQLQHWRTGEEWFWDCLVDADLASNSASWQWVAGCGADAAPYFRIFNPVTQGKKFDPDGDYVRRFLPELAALPTAHLHAPWEAPENVLSRAGIRLGKDYPFPVVDLKSSRERALAAYRGQTAGQG